MKIYLLLFLSLNTLASENERPPLLSMLSTACQSEIKILCPTSEEVKYLRTCLHELNAKISNGCKEEMTRLNSTNKDVSSRGGSLGSFGGFGLVPASTNSLSYEGKIIPNHQIEPMTENKLALQVPILKEKEHSFSLAAQAADLHIKNPIVLSNGTIVPTNLYRTEFGTNYMQVLEEKRSFGVRTSIGYNSDEVLKDSKDLSYSLTAHYSFPGTHTKEYSSSWALTLYLANNGPFLNYIPIPGFIYFYRTSTFTGIFGIPFISMQWTPEVLWTYSLSFFGANINAEAAYGSMDSIQYFTGFNMTKQSFMLHNRFDDKDRLSYAEKKILVGLRLPLLHLLTGELQFGDSFDRKFYVSNKLFSTPTESKYIESSAFASCQLRLAF